jgi:hypothetical protein
MTQTPASTDGGQAPTSGLPQAGTSTTDGQAPVSQTAPTEHERIIERLRAENAAHRADLKKYKDEEQARLQAQMTEAQRLQAAQDALKEQNETLAAQLFEATVYREVGRLASNFNFIISADTLAKMLLVDDDAIKFEDGKPTNIKELLEKLAKAEPDLVKREEQQRAPATPGMNPGRSNIAPPSGNVPGRIPRLSDPGIWNKK